MFEVWGVTGVIGSGKSTAMKILRDMGYQGIDADQVSRIVVDKKTEEGKKGFEQIFRAFGSGVLNNLGELDRPAMRRRMMQNPEDRKTLENILHPLIVDYITKVMMKWKAEGQKLCFIEGTRLIESGFHNMLAGIIFISAKEDLKIKRVMKRDSMGKDEVTMMIRMQDETLMKRIAKHEWKNDATEAALKKTIQAFVDSRIKQAG